MPCHAMPCRGTVGVQSQAATQARQDRLPNQPMSGYGTRHGQLSPLLVLLSGDGHQCIVHTYMETWMALRIQQSLSAERTREIRNRQSRFMAMRSRRRQQLATYLHTYLPMQPCEGPGTRKCGTYTASYTARYSAGAAADARAIHIVCMYVHTYARSAWLLGPGFLIRPGLACHAFTIHTKKCVHM